MTSSTMESIEITEPGGPEVLKTARRPVPGIGPQEVLIRVRAAGVNGPDLMQRKGMYPPPPGASDIPGLEISGEVVAVGPDAAWPTIGEQVCALVNGGGYAEYCAAHASLCLPVPRGVDLVAAATLPETYFTVWSNVFQRAALQPGETLLVHGGAGGIGSTAVQLGRAFGARVLATAGSDDKCAFACGLGADAAINYRDMDFVAQVKELTDGRGVDVVLDILGGDYFGRNVDCLAPDGRMALIAVQRGPKSEIHLVKFMLKRLTFSASTLRPRSLADKAAIAEPLRQRVWPLFADGTLKPVVSQRFALADAAQAHRTMEAGAHKGKLVLVMRE